ELDGLNPTTHQTEVRRRFGVVFQDPSLDSELTAWENMDIHGVLYHVPRRARRERCELLLRLFELWDRRDDLVRTLSGGMHRRHGLVGRSEAANGHGFARSSFPRAHRDNDPGRERDRRGSNAPGIPGVEAIGA